MTTFHVDTPALETAAAQIRTTIDSLHADVALLSNQLQSLDGSWSGPAATAFRTVIGEWHTTSARVTETLTGIGQALGTIHAHYLDTESANVRILGQ